MTSGCVFETAFGWCGVAFSGRKLARCVTPRASRQEAEWALGADDVCGEEAFADIVGRMRRYFDGERVEFSAIEPSLENLPPFARAALGECAKVPYGTVVTYKEIARRVGSPGGARAVGRAMAANPVPIIIPCHRVVRSDGGLGGYSSGVGTKRRLLELEGIELHC